MGSGDFEFDISTSFGTKQLSVSNSQIEIDAAYEGINYLSLFEAKRDLSDDFLVRQLYYPFRVWSSRVTKPVKPVFLIFSNGIMLENLSGNSKLSFLIRQFHYMPSQPRKLEDNISFVISLFIYKAKITASIFEFGAVG